MAGLGPGGAKKPGPGDKKQTSLINGPLPDDDELTEEQREAKALMLDMDSKVNDTLDSTRRMVTLCEESKEAGIRTLVMLDEQGEQLDKVEEGMKGINTDMRMAEKNLEGMEKCCGLCVLPWKKGKSFEKGAEYDKTWKANEDGRVNTNGPRMIVGDQAMIGGNIITRITNDAREEEMENNVGEVNTMVSNLRNMAIDMADQVDTQNQQLDRIKKMAESNEGRIQEANKKATKILKA